MSGFLGRVATAVVKQGVGAGRLFATKATKEVGGVAAEAARVARELRVEATNKEARGARDNNEGLVDLSSVHEVSVGNKSNPDDYNHSHFGRGGNISAEGVNTTPFISEFDISLAAKGPSIDPEVAEEIEKQAAIKEQNDQYDKGIYQHDKESWQERFRREEAEKSGQESKNIGGCR